MERKGKIVYLFLLAFVMPVAYADQYVIIIGENCMLDSDNSCMIQAMKDPRTLYPYSLHEPEVPEFQDVIVVISSSTTTERELPHPDTWKQPEIPEFHNAVVVVSSKT